MYALKKKKVHKTYTVLHSVFHVSTLFKNSKIMDNNRKLLGNKEDQNMLQTKFKPVSAT